MAGQEHILAAGSTESVKSELPPITLVDAPGQEDRERLTRKLAADDKLVSEAISRLAALLEGGEKTVVPEAGDSLLDVCRQVGKPLGITIVKPNPRHGESKAPLEAIVRASRLRARQVALQSGWWTQDNGPMVAFMSEDKRPVALLAKNARSYLLYDPELPGNLRPLTAAMAAELEPFAYVLYRTLPPKALTGMDLLHFAVTGRSGDIAVVLLAGLAAGLLGMLTPIATGIIFDTIIPGAQLNQLFMLSIALLVSAVSVAIFNFTRSIAILRLEGRMDQHVQGAIWDRLLELPVPFFRQFSTGDLADRAMGINQIRRTLSGTTINALISGIFSLFSLALLFWYSAELAKVAVLLTLFALFFMLVTSVVQLRYQKQLAGIGGKLTGLVLENITGIAKFRVSGSEGRVFARWAKMFAQQRQIVRKSRVVQNIVETFTSVYPILSTLIIFSMIVWFSEKNPLSTGSFLAFNAAFGQFLQAVLGVFMSLIGAAGVLPLYQRCKPILETLPETDEAKADPGRLSGEFEVSHLSFRYTPDGPLILNDVSLGVRPGQFVALVGSSGSGKSTLFRLLLGFEQYESGGIFFEGQDLTGLDVRELRRQFGVVLQNGQVLGGDIFTNIVGSSRLTLDDAWEAARMAGLEDDIKNMPMGMHTMISQGGGGLSGGQRQRLLIARALVSKPRILFFDEATSALDNKTQAMVNRSLEGLQTTRVVIAHRLSTIVRADNIYVLDQGRIVQQGSYDELMARPGLFADLAKRQMV
jgi:ATP-binding cassette subfamily C protein